MGTERPPYQILLYYRYTRIADPGAYMETHREFCKSLGLKGRILIAEEGINGTVSGTVEATGIYMETLSSQPEMSGIAFKIDPAEKHPFKKFSIKLRKEIVSLALADDFHPEEITGDRLSPLEFYGALKDDGVVVLDGRNNYESALGRFEGALCPDVDSFRDFPQWIRDNMSGFKDHKILTYCTGGIRCEKLSGFLLREGFKNVSQLDGGIINYGKDLETRGEGFEGSCYVFDERIAVEVSKGENRSIVAACRSCEQPGERYVNCRYPRCNRQIFLCESCEKKLGRFCEAACREALESVAIP